MGIDLGDLVAHRPTTLAAWGGRKVAVDAWNILYQFLSSIRQPDGTPLLDREGRVTSHLAGALYRTANLVEAGIQPVFVFDGPPHPLKSRTLAQRAARKAQAEEERKAALEAGDLKTAKSKAAQASRLTTPMVEEVQELLGALGLPVVQAPGEGEAQASWMAATGAVAAVVSEDYDALLFGAPSVLRHLAVGGRRKLPGKQVWVEVEPEEVRLQESLAALGLDRAGLVEAALLVGTDFHPGVKGIGPRKAVELVRRDGGVETLLRRLAATGADSAAERAVLASGEALADRDEVRRIFLDPPHADVPDLAFRPPEPEAVRRLMVDRHGFSPERVDGALARFAAARGRQAQRGLFEF